MRICDWIRTKEWHGWVWHLSLGIHSKLCDTISPHTVTKRVVSGKWILRVNKKSKGSRAWDQFCLAWDLVKNEQVRGVACCSVSSPLFFIKEW